MGVGADAQKGGQIIDASLVSVPKNRNTRDENKQIKEGKTPDGWDDQPNMKRQKDEDARWTKKYGKSHYGYKNHINIDREHKLIRRYAVTDASVHDSQLFDKLCWTRRTAIAPSGPIRITGPRRASKGSGSEATRVGSTARAAAGAG